MISYIVTKSEAGGRMDKFIKSRLHSAPDSFIYKMARKKNLTLNGRKCEGREILKEGDEIKLYVKDETIALFSGSAENTDISEYRKAFEILKGIKVLKETADILFLNKPSGILTQKAEGNTLSLNEWMIGYLLDQNIITEESLQNFHPSVLNRLDRNTSGIVLCGITPLGSRVVSKMLKDRTLHKYYECLVKGECKLDGRISGYLIKDRAKNQSDFFESLNAVEEKRRKEAKQVSLRVKVLGKENNNTRLSIELETGKSHQIRVMMAHFGYPLVGDAKYGSDRAANGQNLHAARVLFPDKCPEIPYLEGLEVVSKPDF